LNANMDEERIGDRFRQNRARRHYSSTSDSSNNNSNNNNFRQDYNSYNRNNNNNNSYNSYKNNRNRSRQSQTQKLEYGRIQSLRDKFGFIYCANRPIEIFFHYSESLQPIDHLEIGQEVQFYVGPAAIINNRNSSNSNDLDQEEKLSAYQVRLVDVQGSVVWEMEDEPNVRKMGVVERVSRNLSSYNNGRERRGGGRDSRDGNNSGGSSEGTIRLVVNTDENENSDEMQKGALVRYQLSDYTNPTPTSHRSPNSNNSNPSSASASASAALCKHDIVEFNLFTEKRSGLKYARQITLIQSEYERIMEQKEEEMMKHASYEQGVVISLKNGFGFLKSNRRKEDVYFHYSHVELPDDDEDDNDNDNNDEDKKEDATSRNNHTLKEGQEMEFYVVTEESKGRNNKKSLSLSARKIKFLPEGSVIFHQVVAQGITGKVIICPHIVEEVHMNSRMASSRRGGGGNSSSSSSANSSNHNNSLDKAGKVQLDTPITFQRIEHVNDKDGSNNGSNNVELTDVVLYTKDCPTMDRDGKIVSLIREGDTILFDVIRDVATDTCRVRPTKSLVPNGEDSTALSNDDDEGHDDGRNDNTENMTLPSTKNNNNSILPKVRLVSLNIAGRAEGVITSIKDNFGFIELAERNVDVYFKLEEVLSREVMEDLWRNTIRTGQKGGDQSLEEEDIASKITLSVGTEVRFDLSLQPPLNGRQGGGRNNHHTHHNRQKELMKAQRVVLLPPSTLTLTKTFPNVSATVTKVDTYNSFSGALLLDEAVKGMTQKEKHPLITQLIESFSMSLTTNTNNVKAKDDKKMMMRCNESSIIFPDVMSEKENQVVREMIEDKDDLELKFIPVPEYVGTTGQGRVCISKVKVTKSTTIVEEIVVEKALADLDIEENHADTSQVKKNEDSIEESTEIAHLEGNDTATPPNVEESESSKPSEGHHSIVESGTTKKTKKKRKKQVRSTKAVTFERKSLSAECLDNPPAKGDRVTCCVTYYRRTGLFLVTDVQVVERKVKTVHPNERDSSCQGYVLMEPSHTSLSHTPSHNPFSKNSTGSSEGGRWGNCIKEGNSKKSGLIGTGKEEGSILLLSDPGKVFQIRKSKTESHMTEENSKSSEQDASSERDLNGKSEEVNSQLHEEQNYLICTVAYNMASMPIRSTNDGAPKRGDLICFSKGKGNKAKDVRILKRNAAQTVKGTISTVNKGEGIAKFRSVDDKIFSINLSDVISCNVEMLKINERVEGILHEGKMVGICRTSDLYLDSSIGIGLKQRPKLNLTVKNELKGLGGKIIAQSGMAKGPDGTVGFMNGWTTRMSKFDVYEVEEAKEKDMKDLDVTPSVISIDEGTIVKGETDNNLDEEVKVKQDTETDDSFNKNKM